MGGFEEAIQDDISLLEPLEAVAGRSGDSWRSCASTVDSVRPGNPRNSGDGAAPCSRGGGGASAAAPASTASDRLGDHFHNAQVAHAAQQVHVRGRHCRHEAPWKLLLPKRKSKEGWWVPPAWLHPAGTPARHPPCYPAAFTLPYPLRHPLTTRPPWRAAGLPETSLLLRGWTSAERKKEDSVRPVRGQTAPTTATFLLSFRGRQNGLGVFWNEGSSRGRPSAILI